MSPTDRDAVDAALIERLQQRVPLVRRPFELLAGEIGTSTDDVLRRVGSYRREGLIREISGVFDARALGCDVSLVAMRPEDVDAAGRLVAGHPGVSHCYRREGAYPLWFTLSVSPRSRLGLAKTAAALARACDADAPMLLPTIRRYKLHVRFNPFGDASSRPSPAQAAAAGAPATQAQAAQAQPPARSEPPSLGDSQIAAVRALQRDLPGERDPFAAVAAAEGIDADELLVHAADFTAAGWMRRYAAVLHHRRAGAAANVMVAWRVEPDNADRVGVIAAAREEVSHCYLRPPGPDWPYTLYTMIHGRSEADCRTAIRGIAQRTGCADFAELWTVREYAKRRVRLFTDAEAKWEADPPDPARATGCDSSDGAS